MEIGIGIVLQEQKLWHLVTTLSVAISTYGRIH